MPPAHALQVSRAPQPHRPPNQSPAIFPPPHYPAAWPAENYPEPRLLRELYLQRPAAASQFPPHSPPYRWRPPRHRWPLRLASREPE